MYYDDVFKYFECRLWHIYLFALEHGRLIQKKHICICTKENICLRSCDVPDMGNLFGSWRKPSVCCSNRCTQPLFVVWQILVPKKFLHDQSSRMLKSHSMASFRCPFLEASGQHSSGVVSNYGFFKHGLVVYFVPPWGKNLRDHRFWSLFPFTNGASWVLFSQPITIWSNMHRNRPPPPAVLQGLQLGWCPRCRVGSDWRDGQAGNMFIFLKPSWRRSFTTKTLIKRSSGL